MAGAPAPVGLASGPAAVRRIAADQEEGCAGMGSVLARLAGADGLDAMLVQRIARLKEGNVGMVGAPAGKVEVNGPIAVKNTAGRMESAP